MVNCGSSIVFIIAPSKLNFSSLLELCAVLYNATNMILLRSWGLFRSIMSDYPQGQTSYAYLLWGSPVCNKHKEVYVLSLKRLGVEAGWNVMAHAQKPDFVFRAKRTSPFKSDAGLQFSRLLAAEVCASAVVMVGTPRSEVVWRVLATHCIRQFPLHFPSRASHCAITFKLESTTATGCRHNCS